MFDSTGDAMTIPSPSRLRSRRADRCRVTDLDIPSLVEYPQTRTGLLIDLALAAALSAFSQVLLFAIAVAGR
jgi:hypothetical protein